MPLCKTESLIIQQSLCPKFYEAYRVQIFYQIHTYQVNYPVHFKRPICSSIIYLYFFRKEEIRTVNCDIGNIIASGGSIPSSPTMLCHIGMYAVLPEHSNLVFISNHSQNRKIISYTSQFLIEEES